MRVITWNMATAHGPYGQRHAEAWSRLLQLEPDIAFVQEAIPPADLPYGWRVHAAPFEYWASAIVTRLPFTPVSFDARSHLGRFGSYLSIGSVRLPGGIDVVVASVHARAAEASAALLRGLGGRRMERPSAGVPWWNDVAWHGLADHVRGGRFLVGGDWNTSRWADADGVATPAGAEFIDRAAAHGWVDLHHVVAGREVRSWFGTMSEREYQPDMIFADEVTARGLRGASVARSIARDERLSDHAPVIVEVDLTEI